MTSAISDHLATVEKITTILRAVGWRDWANSRREMELLAQDLLDLREFLRECYRSAGDLCDD